ncbi:hypothetical protein L6452_22532 [Arctium lappa]|uniref:Uncharacterized protein n=1 Tax=Arctium lappa TaxID=4217 RepID=A0ACB9B0P4_ARCLA|nr:hypothetical protein L6452_22532 [Arctium lappa]
MDGIHPTFHVCYLRKCLAEEESVIPLSEIRVDNNRCIEEPESILERKTKRLRHKEVVMSSHSWFSNLGENGSNRRISGLEGGLGDCARDSDNVTIAWALSQGSVRPRYI